MSEFLYYDLKQASAMPPSLSVQVAREIGRRIVSGLLAADTQLEDEGRLAERYQVSRAVIRDAVKMLVSKGLLEVRRGIGTKVLSRHHWVLLDDDVLAWHLSTPPNLAFLQQLMEIRLAFEPKASRWAAERGDELAIAEIGAACEAMAAAGERAEDFVVADSRFHRAIIRAAGNSLLSAMEGVIFSALLVSIRVTNKDPRANGASVPLHRDLYQAILNRDGELAERLSIKLLVDARDRLAGGSA